LPKINQKPVYYGGPVQAERGFVLHTSGKEYNSTLTINDTVSLTTSKDILESTAVDQGPNKMLIALGYAGWTAGQLEDEISKNAWLSFNPSQQKDLNALIFDLPYSEKLEIAMALVGVDFASLSDIAGHA
jgi:putative transcriptional regulator